MIEHDLLQIFMLLKECGDNNYLVGGCVRDRLMHRCPKDYDIVTDTPLGDIIPYFKTAGWSVDTVGLQFLVLAVAKHGRQYEIARFRNDGTYGDGRHPDSVEPGTIEQDAARRDFTVNALYADPWTGKIIDPTKKGWLDLQNRVLRFVGKPKDRIKEDYLRIFRFYRFLAKGFKPDPKSLRACRELFTEAYPKITPERVRNEIEKIVLKQDYII